MHGAEQQAQRVVLDVAYDSTQRGAQFVAQRPAQHGAEYVAKHRAQPGARPLPRVGAKRRVRSRGQRLRWSCGRTRGPPVADTITMHVPVRGPVLVVCQRVWQACVQSIGSLRKRVLRA